MRRHLLAVSAVLAVLLCLHGPSPSAAPHRQLLIVLDGLRPDYVTPSLMPALSAFASRGVTFTNHHSVFPTVTRVNASSLVTGAYPGTHGLMGNTVFFPQVDPRQFLNTENRAALERIQAATDGRLLTAPSLGGLLQAAGMKLLVVSAGSPGAAYLLNDKVSGGAIINTEYTLPESLRARVDDALGAVDPTTLSSGQKNTRAVDAFFKVGLPAIDPAVAIMWLTDPDSTAHANGIGHPQTMAALKALDREVQRVFDGLAERGVAGDWNIWITSDHGFSTAVGGPDIAALLRPHERTLADGTPRLVTSGGAIYVRDKDRETVKAIVASLQATAGIGAIFTPAARPGAQEGGVPGTLSFESINWSHERSADILYAGDWTDRANEYGFKGTSAVNGVATHGNSSPYDVHNILFAGGPDVKARTAITTPSANVDFAPTFLTLLGLPVPSTVQGRVLTDALTTAPAVAWTVTSQETQVSAPSGAYTLTAHYSVVQGGSRQYRYFDWTRTERPAAAR